MSALPILYSFRRCPYAMRARLALVVSGLSCALREVALSAKPDELRAASPKATVPVLVLPGGRVIEQSLDIMRWALGQNDPEDWLASDRSDGISLVAANDGSFKHHLDRYKYPHRHDSNPVEHRTAAAEIMAALEVRLARHANLCGPARSLADMAMVTFVRQFAETDRGWFDAQPWPHLQAWLAEHLGSLLFAQIMVRLKPWRPDDAEIVFPPVALP